MTIPQEMITAYVDGEIDPEARIAVERAIATDPDVARRVAQQRSLRDALRAAYDPVLEETVPDRLLAAARSAPAPAPSNVVPLRGSRSPPARRWSAREWTAMAASLIVGALVSALALRSYEAAPLATHGGRLVARGALASALSNQLASRQSPGAPVAIGITFLSKSGGYCRTFALRAPSALAGLACRERGAWQIEVLARGEPEAAGAGPYRPAASSIPQPVLDGASAEMAGEPLDARAEAAARAKGWSR